MYSVDHGENVFQILNYDFEMKTYDLYAYIDSVSEIMVSHSIISSKIIEIPHIKNHFLISRGSTFFLLKIDEKLINIETISYEKEAEIILTCYFWCNNILYFSNEIGGIYQLEIKEKVEIKKIIDCDCLSVLLITEDNEERTFIGKSEYGDLVTVTQNLNENKFTKNILNNIAPIIEFDVFQKKTPFSFNSIFTIGRNLNNVYNGIQTYRLLESESNYKGLKYLWTLKQSPEWDTDSKLSETHFIVMSFIGETHFLGIIESSIEEISKNTNFITDKSTLDIQTIKSKNYLQITENEVRLVEISTEYIGKIVNQLIFKENITLSFISEKKFVLCFGKDKIQVYDHSFKLEKSFQIGKDVSSLSQFENILAICTYDKELILLDLESEKQISRIQLDSLGEGNTPAHSILITKQRDVYFLHIGTRDGMLIIINLNSNSKIERRLGSHPIQLIYRKSFEQIFGISDQSWLIQWNNFKNNYEITYLNIKKSNLVYPFSIQDDENSIISIVNDEIHISSLNTSLETFSKEIPFSGHRILAREIENDVLLLNEKSLAVYNIENEKLTQLYDFKSKPLSILSYKDYILIGSTNGDLQLFSLMKSKTSYSIKLISELQLPGTIYCIAQFNDFIVCSASERLCILTIKENKLELLTHNVCVYFIFGISCSKNVICISDKFDSGIFYTYDEKKNLLDLIHGDVFTKCCGKVLMVDDDFLLGVDRLNSFYGVSTENGIFNCVNYNLGETSLCLKRLDKNPKYKLGSLTMLTAEKMLKQNDIDLDKRHTFILGCVSGSLIQFTALTKREFVILSLLEKILEKSEEKILQSLVGVSHSEYRSSNNVVDGEFLLNLFYSSKQKEIIYEINEKLGEMVSLEEVKVLLNKF